MIIDKVDLGRPKKGSKSESLLGYENRRSRIHNASVPSTTVLFGQWIVSGKRNAAASERNSHRRSPFTLGHHLPTVGAYSVTG